MAFQGTPAAEQTEKGVIARFSHLYSSIGQYNRRYIGGTTIWSQHAYGNAIDIMVGYKNYAAGDVIYAWLVKHKEELGIRTILWRVRAHHDHIHVDFWPRGIRTPSTSSTGVSTFKYSSGRIVSAVMQLIAPEKVWNDPKSDDEENTLRRGDKGRAVAELQATLIERGHDLGDFTPFAKGFPPGADGIFGGATEAPVQAEQGKYDLPKNGVVDGVLASLIGLGPQGSGGTVDQDARNLAADAKNRADKANKRLNQAKAAL